MQDSSTNCKFPLCRRHAEKNGYCVCHRIYSDTPATKEPKQPIVHRSEKMKGAIKDVKKLYPVFLAKPENKFCRLKMKGCSKVATVVHHVRGRTGKMLTNEKHWLPSCASCNVQVEVKDGEARDKGLKKSKHEPNYKRNKV